MEKNVWKSFLDSSRTQQQRVELTGTITNRLLRFGIGDSIGYEKEVETLDRIFAGLPIDRDVAMGFEAMKIFIPQVPGEIRNRYDAIKHEIGSAGVERLVVGACGLSPLGIAHASKGMDVIDTDLPDVINHRDSVISLNSNYRTGMWNLLECHEPGIEGSGKKTGMVVEGLIFYLDEAKQGVLHSNLQQAKRQISPENPMTFIFDIYVSEIPPKQRDSVAMPGHSEWEHFINLVSNVHDGYKADMKSRKQAMESLEKAGYSNVRVSSVSREDNAHTILACEYR